MEGVVVNSCALLHLLDVESVLVASFAEFVSPGDEEFSGKTFLVPFLVCLIDRFLLSTDWFVSCISMSES